MSTTIIVPQDRENLADWMTCEIECLADEIFLTNYACSYGQALDEALASVVEMINYAEDWNHQCLIAERARRRTERQGLLQYQICRVARYLK